jgi:azurin
MRAFIFLLCAASTAFGQSSKRWKEIGRTSSGNVVSYDTRSVKTAKGITSVTLQVKFTTPAEVSPGVKWYLSRHEAMFDCAKHRVASKLNTYYGDPAGTKVVKRDVVKIPGFGPAIGGSMAQVAMDFFCKQ